MDIGPSVRLLYMRQSQRLESERVYVTWTLMECKNYEQSWNEPLRDDMCG